MKIADKVCNVRDVALQPPVDWSHARRREYLDWTERVVAECRGVNPALEATFDTTLRMAREVLAREVSAAPPREETEADLDQ